MVIAHKSNAAQWVPNSNTGDVEAAYSSRLGLGIATRSLSPACSRAPAKRGPSIEEKEKKLTFIDA